MKVHKHKGFIDPAFPCQEGCDMEETDDYGRTPMDLACHGADATAKRTVWWVTQDHVFFGGDAHSSVPYIDGLQPTTRDGLQLKFGWPWSFIHDPSCTCIHGRCGLPFDSRHSSSIAEFDCRAFDGVNPTPRAS